MSTNEQTVMIAGSSGHLKVIIDIIEKEGRYKILGLLDPVKDVGAEVSGYEVIGRDEDLPDLLSRHVGCKVFVAIGDNWLRQRVVNKLITVSPNIDFATAIHPSAQIGKGVRIGKGVAIMAGSVINSDTVIGDFTIVNTKASIDHDCRMLEFSSLAPDATVGGNVTIGKYSAISIGATVKHGLTIGNHSVIGAGALLMKDCADNVIMYGVPAKEIRKHEIGEKYL